MVSTILVTGAAGLIGGEVSARLAAREHQIIVLNHRTRKVRGNDGREVPVAAVLAGYVRADGLGIGQSFPVLEVIVHCAASLAFESPEAELTAINWAGTRNVAEGIVRQAERMLWRTVRPVTSAAVRRWR